MDRYSDYPFVKDSITPNALLLLPLFSGQEYPGLSMERLHHSYSPLTPLTKIDGLSFRAQNILGRIAIVSLGQLLLVSKEKLMSERAFGITTLENVQQAVADHLGIGKQIRNSTVDSLSNNSSLPPLETLNLPSRAMRSLHLLKINTTADFMQLDISLAMELVSIGETTCECLRKEQQKLYSKACSFAEVVGGDNSSLALEQPLFTSGAFNAREINALRQMSLETVGDFLQQDLQ